jgi:hypothetical protein
MPVTVVVRMIANGLSITEIRAASETRTGRRAGSPSVRGRERAEEKVPPNLERMTTKKAGWQSLPRWKPRSGGPPRSRAIAGSIAFCPSITQRFCPSITQRRSCAASVQRRAPHPRDRRFVASPLVDAPNERIHPSTHTIALSRPRENSSGMSRAYRTSPHGARQPVRSDIFAIVATGRLEQVRLR